MQGSIRGTPTYYDTPTVRRGRARARRSGRQILASQGVRELGRDQGFDAIDLVAEELVLRLLGPTANRLLKSNTCGEDFLRLKLHDLIYAFVR